MANIKVRRGSEGPEHDPYSFTEVTFYFTDKRRKPVTIHRGLGDWIKHGKKKYEWDAHCVATKFEELTGISVRKAEEIPDILFQRMLKKYTKEEQHNILECIEADQAMLRNCY